MRKLMLAAQSALLMLVMGCGSSSNNTTVSSKGSFWQATLLESTGAATTFDFVTQFSIATGGSLSVGNLTFITANPCFVSGASANGMANLTVDTSTNQVTGTLNYAVQSGTPSGNTLTLTGPTVTGTESGSSLTGATVTGGWALTGSATCTGGGTFTLKQQ